MTGNKPQKPTLGNPSLVSDNKVIAELKKLATINNKYNVEDFFAKPKASAFSLSPNGKYLSYIEKDDHKKRHVFVKDIENGSIIRAIEEKEEPIKSYGWINNERLYYVIDNKGDENYHLFATDINGKNCLDLTPYSGTKVSIQSLLKEDKDHIIVLLNLENKQIFEPYKLNILDGKLTKLFTNNDPINPIQGYDFDKFGELRAYTKLVNGVETEFYYKDLDTNTFQLLKTTYWDDIFSIIGFDYGNPNPYRVYMATNVDSDKTRIVIYDLKEDKIIEEIYANDQYDVSGMHRSIKRDYEIDYFAYYGEKLHITPVSDFYTSLHLKMTQQFEEYAFNIIDFDDNESIFLILVQSDQLYGKYYQYNLKEDTFSLLYDLMPQLKEEDMAQMHPITFTNREGGTLHGYITLPNSYDQAKPVPMIVNPHGGPQGIRDTWGFDPEAQLFAHCGYATLHVNFRISGGYGKAFLRSGFKQIGRKVMEDIEDGVQYTLQQGWIDPRRIAIYGGSHGGYATLMGLVKTPELYACGVDYVGVSNIETFFKSFPEYWKPMTQMVKEIWYDLDNPQEAKIAREVSPIHQVDKIKKPLLVVQGANDPRVNIHESDQIVEALRNKGYDVPYMVKYDEGHGFFKEENRLDFYQTMIGFLSKHLK